MRAGRIVAVILGALLAVTGLGAIAGGAALVVVHLTQRDAAGYFMGDAERYATSTAVLVAEADLGPADQLLPGALGTVRVRAAGPEGRPVFVGIAPAEDVRGWLAGSAYEQVRPDGDRVVTGSRPVSPPMAQPFWAAAESGTGPQVVTWPAESGRWALVVMNADAQPGVVADVAVGARTGVLVPISILAGAVGLVLLGAGVLVMLLALGTVQTPEPAVADGPAVAGTYPVRLDARFDPAPSRWLWLVKWLLLIPHAVVLALLWLAVIPLTVVAGVAILFTGRYPRPVFAFVTGVLRWTWRVGYYGYSALGTDRYPPFSLDPDPAYPAAFAVDYPRRLSRGLVLIKWWLLAIPHYLVVALFTGGWTAGWTEDDRRTATGIGLITVLVLVAAFVLLFSGRYPQPVYDFVMGLNRWCFRVAAYALLMRDEYPPFRLDTGGTDPGSVPVQPVPPRDRGAELVGASR